MLKFDDLYGEETEKEKKKREEKEKRAAEKEAAKIENERRIQEDEIKPLPEFHLPKGIWGKFLLYMAIVAIAFYFYVQYSEHGKMLRQKQYEREMQENFKLLDQRREEKGIKLD